MAGILTFLFHPFLINKFDKRKCVIGSYSVLIITPIILALLYRCDPEGNKDHPESTPNWKIFFAFAFIARFLQGIADSLFLLAANQQ